MCLEVCASFQPFLLCIELLRDRDERDSCRYYLIAHQTQLMDAYMKTENTEERAAIVQKRLGETYLITEVYSFSSAVDFLLSD